VTLTHNEQQEYERALEECDIQIEEQDQQGIHVCDMVIYLTPAQYALLSRVQGTLHPLHRAVPIFT
jgi:hypothetical protein